MPTITSASDFLAGETKIPNAVNGNAGSTGVNDDLAAIMEKYERELLIDVLGVDQYTVFKAALGDINSAEKKWKDFAILIKPILVNFIYCNWLRFNEVVLNTAGSGKAQAKGQSLSDPINLYVPRWNEMVRWLFDLKEKMPTGVTFESGLLYEFENSFGL